MIRATVWSQMVYKLIDHLGSCMPSNVGQSELNRGRGRGSHGGRLDYGVACCGR